MSEQPDPLGVVHTAPEVNGIKLEVRAEDLHGAALAREEVRPLVDLARCPAPDQPIQTVVADDGAGAQRLDGHGWRLADLCDLVLHGVSVYGLRATGYRLQAHVALAGGTS